MIKQNSIYYCDRCKKETTIDGDVHIVTKDTGSRVDHSACTKIMFCHSCAVQTIIDSALCWTPEEGRTWCTQWVPNVTINE